MKLVLVAEEAAGAMVLKAIRSTHHDVVAVLTSGGTDRPLENPVRGAARDLPCDLFPAAFARDRGLGSYLAERRVDMLLNVHSLHVIPEATIDVPVMGSFNLHPGPLPEYAGLNAPSWALYRGESHYGVTLHHMVSEIDAGSIVARTDFEIDPADTALTLMAKCVRMGVPLVMGLLAVASEDPAGIAKRAQDSSQRRYYGKEIPQEGLLDWSRPARDVANFVRACDYGPYPSPWGHPKTWTEDGREVLVKRVKRTDQPCREPPGMVGKIRDDGVFVATKDEWMIVSRCQWDGDDIAPREILSRGTRLTNQSLASGVGRS